MKRAKTEKKENTLYRVKTRKIRTVCASSQYCFAYKDGVYLGVWHYGNIIPVGSFFGFAEYLSLLKIHPSDFKTPFPFRLRSPVVMRLVWCTGDEGLRQQGWL